MHDALKRKWYVDSKVLIFSKNNTDQTHTWSLTEKPKLMTQLLKNQIISADHVKISFQSLE